MKKNIFLVILLLFTINIFSQTEKQKKQIVSHYELEKLSKLEKEFNNTYKARKREALDYAKKHNIKTVIEDEEGNISTLQRINEYGIPIYYKTYNTEASGTTRTNSLYSGGSLGIEVEGQDMEIGIWDGGLVRTTHELLENRVVQLDNPNNYSDHATHVSGTLIGSETPVSGDAKGMAFKANLLAYDYNNDLPEMISQATDGMLISNHSYGVDISIFPDWYLDLGFGYYDDSAQSIDELAYNAPYYLMVFAAGNDRNDNYNTKDNGYDLLMGRPLAKNNLTVAAVEQVANYTSPSSVTMSSFSSWGPVDDGRIKPDISGDGVNVYSSTAISDQSYAYFSGTSMASPNVAGSLLLLQQLNRNLTGSFFKSATIKALAIHTALEAGNADGPDYEYGWGLLNMEGAASVLLEDGESSIYEEKTLTNQTTYTKTIHANENEPLKVTVVWTDPEGTPIDFWDLAEDDDTPMLINDLDVRVEDENGTVYYPWKLDPAIPSNPATKGDNSVDNVEKIEIENPQGEYTISVTHKGTLQNLSQDFSIVVSGVAESEFTFAPDNIYKTFCNEDIGEFSLNFFSQEDYSGSTTFSVSGLPVAINSSFSSNTISQDQVVSLFLDDLDQVSSGEYTFTITATGQNGGSISKELTMNILEVPGTVTGLLPQDDVEEGINLSPLLSWDNVNGSDYYLIELSEGPNFTTITYTAETQDNFIQISELNPDTTYYWRVKAFNSCYSSSNYSSDNFHTIGLACNTVIYSSDTPVTINTFGPNTQQSTLLVSEDISIEDINVYVQIEHTWLGDISLFLTSPSGTEIPLIERICPGGEDIDVIFDDAGIAYECANAVPSLNGFIKPDSGLFSFTGENATGEWTLTVVDYEENDGGAIENFGIEFCGYAEPTMSVNDQLYNDFQIYPNPTQNSFAVSGLKEVSALSIFDINGRKLNHISAVANNQKIDVSNLQSGVYFVRIESGSTTFVTKKLIVN